MESGESLAIHFGVAACEVMLFIAPSVIFFLSEYDLFWCEEQFGECCSGLVDSSNLYFQKNYMQNSTGLCIPLCRQSVMTMYSGLNSSLSSALRYLY